MLTEARREVIALLERHGSLDAPELGPLLDAARGASATSGRGDRAVEGRRR